MRSPLRAILLALLLLAPELSAQERDRRLEWSDKKEYQAVVTRCLTWLTGTGEENDYVSVGRLANYFGFVHFRVSSGHTVDRSGLGGDVVELLRPSQLDALFDLNREQWPHIREVREARILMNDLLESMLDEGAEYERDEFVSLGRTYGELEAQLGGVIASGFSRIFESLDEEQLIALRALRVRWESGEGRTAKKGNKGKRGERAPKKGQAARRRLKDLPQDEVQEFWSLATRFLTWITGTEEKNDFDTAGKPSQHFGFVSLRVESGHAVTRGGVADGVIEVLSSEQEAILREVTAANREDFEAFFKARAEINRELERGLAGEEIRSGELASYGALQGETEGRMTWRQAMGFLDVRDRLEDEHAQALLELRERYLDLPTPEEVALDPLAAGRRLFRLCGLCHVPQQEGRAIGPPLTSVFNRPVASLESFEYSAAMRQLGGTGARWTEDSLSDFLTDPRAHLPGTAMGFRGLKDASLRGALIQFLRGGDLAQGASLVEVAPKQESNETKPEPLTEQPNILFLLSDDQPWDGLSVRMDPEISGSAWDEVKTPTLDALAKQGMRFARAYSPSPVCSPTRASLQTGKSPGQLGWTKAAPVVSGASYRLVPPRTSKSFSASEVTFAERLAALGYKTAHFGKWHIQGGGPGEHGYQVHDGETGNRDAAPHIDPNPVDIFGMVARTEAFMKEAMEKDEPFFAQLSFHALHYPENASEKNLNDVKGRLARANEKTLGRAALTQDLDEGIAILLKSLQELGLAENTYVIYMSDNGAKPNSGLLSGGKGDVWESGVRVPMIVRGPGVEAGSLSRVPVVGYDLFPTFLEWAGDEEALPEGIEGGSLTALLSGSSGAVERPYPFLSFHFPHYQGQGGPQSALIEGDLKLMRFYEDDSVKLFDVAQDPGERRDLAKSRRGDAERLGALLEKHLDEIGARMPSPNPDFDPEAEPSAKKRGKDRKERGGGRRGRRGGGEEED